MNLSPTAARELGSLAGRAEEKIRDLILGRGGKASNV
jgi:hypothetical protein